MTQLNDTVQLHNLPMMITVALDKNDPTRNVIKSYKPRKGGDGQGAGSGTQPAPAASGTAPWART